MPALRGSQTTGKTPTKVFAGDAAELARICALHHRRRLSKDLVLSFNRQRYIVQTGGAPRYGLRGQLVDGVSYADGRIELWHGLEKLPFQVFDPAQCVPEPVDDKSLNARLDELVKVRKAKTYRPAPDHPGVAARRSLQGVANWPPPEG
jgi:hypothetical protein